MHYRRGAAEEKPPTTARDTLYFSELSMTILVTGGAGFIGSNFVLEWCDRGEETIVNLDRLTYAGNLENLSRLANDNRHIFIRGDICDAQRVSSILSQYTPRAIINFAAESHVDRSIQGPDDFVQTNIVGTFRLLDAARQYWETLPEDKKSEFRFLHVSTDEVYGSLTQHAAPFTEQN